MAKQDNSSHQKGWKPAECNMTTSPSVGRFGNDQTATLYVKGSSAKFDNKDVRKTMAPYSNHGNLPQQESQQPATDIVDLRTASGTEYKVCSPSALSFWPLHPCL